MAETDSQPIAENEQVKELLALLKDNNTPGYEEFAKLIEHVTGMEQRLLEATEELKARVCELCGRTDVKLEVHHVNKVKNLKGKEPWEQVMIAKRRKTLAVCHDCHQKIHHGF